MGQKIWSALAVTAAAGLVLSGCSPAPDTSASATQAESFPAVYAQTVEWGACGEEHSLSAEMLEKVIDHGGPGDTFECAMIEAPLDWNDPTNRETIELAALHVPATGTAEPIGTLLGNPGGPGGGGIEFMASMTAAPGFDQITEQYDLLGFDPRGIEASASFECDDVSEISEVQLAVCADENPLAHSMGTSQVARDMDLMRALMGEQQLDYLGYSYGTILGATYATLFPERVGNMVLDSAPDHTWASPVGRFDQSVAIAQQIAAMFAECDASDSEAEVEACPVRTERSLLEVADQLAEQPLVATDGSEIDGATLYGYLISKLYGGSVGRAEALDTVAGALAGDQAQIDDIATVMATGGASVSMAGQIVSCHSFPQDPDIVGLLERVEERGIPELLGGPEITDESIAGFTDISCDALPESGDDLEAFSAPDDQTMLVIGITGDHATPYENGQNLARELGNTRFVTLEGVGHAASYINKSACVDDITTAFLLRGELPEQETVCQSD